ncbi:hypothetical protein G9A89_003696 [Geosiphon pyriformis]|nr:hypothetical protein G9A89_003696 [Geosiphon pyriformis]
MIPTSPDGSTILKPGQEATITWKEDGKAPPLSTFDELQIDFMTGADLKQTVLANVGTVPGTDGKIKFTIPAVEPAGKIYFFRFQFNTRQFFTTRFIITDAEGKYPPSTNPPPPVGQNEGGNGRIISLVTSKNTNTTNTTSEASKSDKSSSNESKSANDALPTSLNSTNINANNATSKSNETTTVPSAAKMNSSSDANLGFRMSEVIVGIVTLIATIETINIHARRGARTLDLKVKSLTLYRLSYPGILSQRLDFDYLKLTIADKSEVKSHALMNLMKKSFH